MSLRSLRRAQKRTSCSRRPRVHEDRSLPCESIWELVRRQSCKLTLTSCDICWWYCWRASDTMRLTAKTSRGTEQSRRP
eukprot:768754-Hanusia_phi.AAC.4